MKYFIHYHKIIIIICAFFSLKNSYAQLGFCNGNSGNPIFTETFGTGVGQSALPTGTTTYAYANGGNPEDGFYTVSNNSNFFDWFVINDHTENDVNGKMLIVNSSFSAGEFYTTTISGLCENTSYEFSSWLINLSPINGFCGNSVIPINVTFQIWDNTNTNLLATGSTGNISSTVTPNWQQYALVFQTLPAQTSVILKMINNSAGGCGNDLAIDDIVFKSCGDLIDISDTNNSNITSICSAQTPYPLTIIATPDNAVFSSHFYQWEESTNGITWNNIPGETSSTLSLAGITSSGLYRVKVAESAVNLNNSFCNVLSEIYQVEVNQLPNMPTIECWQTATINNTTCSWEVIGTQPVAPTNLECWETATFNTTTCAWEVIGTQPASPTNLECWETATFNTTSCTWEVSGTQPTMPILECWETATFNTTTCAWDVTGTQPASPTNLECWETATFNTTSCTWEVSGTQPTMSILECWETATFNTTTCAWDVTGTQPASPTNLECWETATFNNTSCTWDVIGTQPTMPNIECWETATFNTTTCAWDVTGTQPAAPTGLECWQTATFNNTICNWEISGTEPTEPTNLECWQTTAFNESICSWEILGDQPINYHEETILFCKGENALLQTTTDIINPTYTWSTNEVTPQILVTTQGSYEVVITDGCFTTIITFIVIEIEAPIISNVYTLNKDMIVETQNEGDFLYSIDGINYQNSPVFNNLEGGYYTVYVKDINNCVEDSQSFIHFIVPKFFTPNNDTYHDTWRLKGIEYYASSEVQIFDRYGKLLYYRKNASVSWNGMYRRQPLPTSDYWYVIIINGQRRAGHFTLKR